MIHFPTLQIATEILESNLGEAGDELFRYASLKVIARELNLEKDDKELEEIAEDILRTATLFIGVKERLKSK